MFSGPARNLLVYGGARSGKTAFICYAIITRALKARKSRHAIFRKYGVSAKQSIGLDTIPKILELAYPGVSYKYHAQDGYFSFPNKSEIWLAGLDDKERVEKVLGKEYVSLYFNEASEIPLSSYIIAQTRLAQNVRQVDGRALRPRNYVDLNPTTWSHWTYQMWVSGVNPDGGAKLKASEYAHMMVNPIDNMENLPPDYISTLEQLPEHQRKRFLEGHYSGDDENALWRRSYFKIEENPPEMKRVVVAIDPAISNDVGSDETGIVVMGIGVDGNGYVLADESGKFRPEEWARRAVSAYDTFDADCIVAEINQGGAMVDATIKAQVGGRVIPYHGVTAIKGKVLRAEPIAALYERGKVRHVSQFDQLCDQMCNFSIGDTPRSKGYSPDRVDALVYAATELFPRMVTRSAQTVVKSIPTARYF